MASFGENLKREREMRGVTLQEMSAATKISTRFLQALEADEFSKLPAGIFTRGFIRAYAQYLGLDEEHVLAEYQLVARPSVQVDLTRLAFSKPQPPRSSSRAPLMALVVAAALLAAGYTLYRHTRRLPEPQAVSSTAQPLQASTVAKPSAPASEPSALPETAATPQEAAPRPSEQTGPPMPGLPEAEGGLILQIAATERSWVAIDVDGKTALQRILNPNEIQTLRAKSSFDVTTGNAQGIILTLNGETLKPLGRRGEVKSVRLTHDDLKKLSP